LPHREPLNVRFAPKGTELLRRTTAQGGVGGLCQDFGGPQAVLAYLSRYTHRVAISDPHFDSLRSIGKWIDLISSASAPLPTA
jgi:hypothetical protein